MTEKTTRQLLEEQSKTMELLTQVVASLAEGQGNLTQQLHELRATVSHDRAAEYVKATVETIKSHDTSADDEADAALIANSPVVEVTHNEDEPRVIGFNGQPRIVLRKGVNLVPKPYADIYAGYLEDVRYRDWNAKRLQIPPNRPKGYEQGELEYMLLQSKHGE